jgi:hypothetical protein
MRVVLLWHFRKLRLVFQAWHGKGVILDFVLRKIEKIGKFHSSVDRKKQAQIFFSRKRNLQKEKV